MPKLVRGSQRHIVLVDELSSDTMQPWPDQLFKSVSHHWQERSVAEFWIRYNVTHSFKTHLNCVVLDGYNYVFRA